MMERPGVGTGVYIRKDRRILMGRREGKNGKGTWCAPGGKVEMYEDLLAHCVREVTEEAGIQIANIRLMTVTNDRTPEWETHYVTLHFAADWVSGEPKDEPGGMVDWGWYEWEKLPDPLFASTRNFLKSGYNPLNF